MKKKEQIKPKNKSGSLWLALAAVVIVAGAAWFALNPKQTATPEASGQIASSPAPSSQYATLSPSMFTGRARDAYQVAKDIPEVLKEVQCYCGCSKSAGHRSNLDCFTDEHGFG